MSNSLKLPWMDMGNEPTDGTPFLVYLSEPHLGSRIAAATKHEVQSGTPGRKAYLYVIGGYNDWDLEGKPLKWAPMPEEPEDV